MTDFADPGLDWRRLRLGVRTFSAAGQLVASDDVALCDPSGGSFDVEMPPSAATPGKVLTVKRTDISEFEVGVTGRDSDRINGLSRWVLPWPLESADFASDGNGGWWVIRESLRRVHPEQFAGTANGTSIVSVPFVREGLGVAFGAGAMPTLFSSGEVIGYWGSVLHTNVSDPGAWLFTFENRNLQTGALIGSDSITVAMGNLAPGNNLFRKQLATPIPYNRATDGLGYAFTGQAINGNVRVQGGALIYYTG